jgi:peptidoglycan-N-acetylglucosamine deacetylase
MPRVRCLLTFCFCLTVALGAADDPKERIMPERVPDKTVVMTFDDSVRSDLEFVAPLLKEKGFGATFFVSHAWMPDSENYLSFEEVAELHKMGFEVGNHTWNHVALHRPEDAELTGEEVRLVEEALAEVGVPRPMSFSWPGNHFGPEALAELQKLGYRFARRGTFPEPPQGPIVGMGPLYDPLSNHPLLVPTSGLAVPGWTLSDFRAIVDRARDGKIVVLQFHGVPDIAHPGCSLPPERFREFVEYLSQEGFSVIALRDLEKYLDRRDPPNDPVASKRFFI